MDNKFRSTNEQTGKQEFNRTPLRIMAFVFFALALVTLACTCSGLSDPLSLVRKIAPPEAEEVIGEVGTAVAGQASATPRPQGGDPLPDLLERGSVAVSSIDSETDGEIQGKVLTVQLTNPGSEEVVVDIPCGLVLEPVSSGEDQRMMVIQPASVIVPAGGEAEVAPYVACVDPGRDAPSLESTYQVGEMSSGDLLVLAQCLCEQDLGGGLSLQGGEQMLGVQFAVWSVSTGESPGEFFGGEIPEGGAAGELFGGEGGELVEDLMEAFAAPAHEILEGCGLE